MLNSSREESQNKEEKRSRIGRAAKFMFNFSAWVGADEIKESSAWIGSLFKRVFFGFSGKHAENETFEQAMERLQLKQADLEKQAKHFLATSFGFFILGILGLFYSAYLWGHGDILVFVAALIACLLVFTQAYFYSFWCFQVRVRRLGCTFRDWLNWLFKGKQV